MPTKRSTSTTPEWLRVYASIALVLCIVLASLPFLIFRLPINVWTCLGMWLLSVNFVAFVYYGIDKRRARNGKRRIPEIVLHGLAFLGGSPGAYLGMRTFRHKTIKGTFQIWFWCIVSLQMALAVAVLIRILVT